MEKMDFFKKTSSFDYSSQNKINQNQNQNQNKTNESTSQKPQLNQINQKTQFNTIDRKDNNIPFDTNKINDNTFLDTQKKMSLINEINYNSVVSEGLEEINMKLYELKTLANNLQTTAEFDPNEMNKTTRQILEATNKIYL